MSSFFSKAQRQRLAWAYEQVERLVHLKAAKGPIRCFVRRASLYLKVRSRTRRRVRFRQQSVVRFEIGPFL